MTKWRPREGDPRALALPTADLVELCGQTWLGDGLLLRSHSASRRFYFVAPDTDCGLWVRAAAPGDRIRLQFRFFLVYSLPQAALEPNASAPAPPAGPCAPGSYLQLYEGPPGAPRSLGPPLCGRTIPAPVASSGRFLGLRLVTRGRQPRVDFVGEVTSFRLGGLGWRREWAPAQGAAHWLSGAKKVEEEVVAGAGLGVKVREFQTQRANPINPTSTMCVPDCRPQPGTLALPHTCTPHTLTVTHKLHTTLGHQQQRARKPGLE